MKREERFRLALDQRNWSIADLARAVGVSQPAASTVVNGVRPGRKLLPKMAESLGVTVEWLTVGNNPPSWARHNPGRSVEALQSAGVPSLDVEGQVSAGTGDIDQWADVGGHLRFGAKWAAVRVKGDSAYPVVYPDQYALVDYARAVTVEQFDEAAGWDLDDDVVLVRLHNGGALLKRFCFHPPNDFILASVNGGRRSPLVKRTDIHCIVPVVGTIYHGADERAPDRWKLKRSQRGKA